MPFFRGDHAGEVFILCADGHRPVEHHVETLNDLTYPSTTIGIPGHRGERFQLGVSKSLYPHGVSILAFQNVQPEFFSIDLDADPAHTHRHLDPSVERWYNRSWIVEHDAWTFGNIDTLALAFFPRTIGGSICSSGYLLKYLFSAADRLEWQAFASHDELLERFSQMSLEKPDEPVAQPSPGIAAPLRPIAPKPFYSRRKQEETPEPKLSSSPAQRLQDQPGEQQARPDSPGPVQPASLSAAHQDESAAAPNVKQPAPAMPDEEDDDIVISDLIRRPLTGNDNDKDGLEASDQPVPSHEAAAVPSMDTETSMASPIDVDGGTAQREPVAERPTDNEAPMPLSSNDDDGAAREKTPADRSTKEEAYMVVSSDDDGDDCQPRPPRKRLTPQKTVAERSIGKQTRPSLPRDKDDDGVPLAPRGERRIDKDIDHGHQPASGRKRPSTSRKTAAARRIERSSPLLSSSDRDHDDDDDDDDDDAAEYRPSPARERVCSSTATVEHPLLELDGFLFDESPRRSSRLLERQRQKLERVRQKRLEELKRSRKKEVFPRRPQYPSQASCLLKAMWTAPVYSVTMTRRWPMRVANNETVMKKLMDCLECIVGEDEEEAEEVGDRVTDDERAAEDGVASDLWLTLEPIVGPDTRQRSPLPDVDDEEEEAAMETPVGQLKPVARQRSPKRRSPPKPARKTTPRKTTPRKASPRKTSLFGTTVTRGPVGLNHANITFTTLELQEAWHGSSERERRLEARLDQRRKDWAKLYSLCALHKAYVRKAVATPALPATLT